MATPPKHDTQTIRIVTLDFNGGSHVYRNPELGMNIPVRIAPSGISADRARTLAEALNKNCADSQVHFEVGAASSENASAVRIGRTADFDRYGAFLGLAEGIGSGDAYVLLDDSASDSELVDVIRHEAGHILGTLDHGGAGLARYANFYIEYDYSRAYVDAEGEVWRQYLKTKTSSISTGISSSPSNNDSISVGAYEDSLSITYEYDSYKRAYDGESGTWYWPSPPETEYIEDNYTYNALSSLSGVHAKYRINNSGGTITSCTAQNISVGGKVYRDHTLIYGYYNGESSYSFNEYSEPRFYRGVAEGCTSTVLEVTGYAYATDCKAARITVSGSVHLWTGWWGDSSDYIPFGDYEVLHALIENCTVTGTKGDGTYWSSYDYETGNLSGGYSSELVVDFGATANHVTVQSAGVKIGNGSSAPQEDTGAARRYAILGKAVVNNLVVNGGDVYVYYGGELHNANIKGTLRIADGALLDGTINTTRVELSNVVPTTTITIKLDLRDFAIANYTEWKQEDIDEHNYVSRKIEYFANYTTRTTEYTCFHDKDGDVRYDDINVTYDTFDNKDGRFDMRNWKYTFEADLGSVDATAMPYIVVDFGGTEKMFDSGKLKFNYPSTNRNIQFQMNSNELKWEEQWSDGEGASYQGTILYDTSLYGEAADVLWLEFGEDPEAEYTVELAPEMAGSTEITTVTVAESGSEALPDARIQGATLVVKGGDVQSGELVVKAEDSAHLDHECALELIVVPEEIPVIGKLGAKKYAEMLKKAQKDHITTTINDILPYNIHTEIFGSKFDLTNMGISLTVDWTEPSIELKLQGKMEWELGKGTAGTGKQLKLVVDFSGDNNYILITHEKGKYSWDIVGEIKAPDFKIGKFAFSNMVLKVNKGQASFSASAYVQLPWIKYSFGGSIGIVDGYLDSMAIGVDSLNIPLGGTGLFLQKIEGGIKGIATELNLSFEGTLGLTAGPKFKVEFVDWLGLDNGVYSLCEMTLTGSISTAGDLEGSSSCVILGGLATGSGSASLKGGELTVKGTYTFLNSCISIKGELHASTGGITIEGTGTATVPREKYFGPLAGYSMSANVAAEVRTSASDSFVMAWQIISVLGNEYTIGFKSNFEGKVSMLGSTDVLKKEEMDSSLRSLKSISVPSASVAAPLRGEATPSASEKYLVSDSGLTFFQVYLSVSGASMSLTYGGTEYSQADIAAGNFANMQVVADLTGSDAKTGNSWITVAVDNAALGEWTINAYGDAAATFGAYTLTSAAAKPVISAVEAGEGKRSATIRYTLGDLSAAENATISVFRADSDSTGYTGARIAEFAAAEATGVFEYAPGDDLPGGSYSFYLMVTSDNLAPSYSDRSEACVFLTIDTEAPDQIQVISSEWKSTGTVISWEAPWDDQGVAGYKIRYAIEENVTAEPGDAGDEGTGETGGEGLTETGGEGTGETGEKEMTEVDVTTNTFTFDKVANGTYVFQVAAYDAAGNLSAWSEQQSCLVFTVANATYKDLTLAEPLKLDEYESAVNIIGGDFSITTAANSLLSGSTVGNAEISGILDDSTVTGKTVLLADGTAYAVTVNGKFEIQGTADGVTVAEGGSLLIGKGAVAKNITVNAGGSVTLQDGAEYAGLVMDYGSNLIIPDGNTYRLTGDIRTAGTLSTRSFLFANGHKIRFEQYRQTDEMSKPGTTSARDDVAFMTDFDKLGTGVLEIEIDCSTSGNYKIADKITSFNGTIMVVDHATGVSASVGFNDYTLVGGSLCKLSKISTGAYSTSSLYLLTQSAAVDAPTITVTDAETDLKETITVTAKSPCAKRTYRYSLNEDMSDAVVVTVADDTPLALAKSGLTADATYYLQAKVESAYGVESPWSETASFTVVPKYVAPPLTVTAEKNGTSSIVLTVSTMETPKYTIDAYEFRYADNPEMEDAVTSTTYWSDSRISRDQLVDGQYYYIQARAKSRGEWGEWGPTLVFNTENYDYDGVTVGDSCEYTELQLNGKKARNITVLDGGSVYGGSAGSVDGITLNGGYFGAACPVTDAVVNGGIFSLQSYGSVSDLVLNGGTLDLSYGTLNGATVGADATVTIDGSRYRPTITGTILIRGIMTIDEYNSGITTDASFVFDLGAHESETMRDTAFIDYISPLSSAKSFTVQLDDTPEAGDYRLGSLNGDPFCVSFTLAANDGTVLGVLEPGSKAILHNGLYYSLFTSDTVVCLHVSTDDTPVILGKIKLSKNGTVFTADNRYQNLTVSASDKCDHVLMEDGGQIDYLTVGDGGSVEVCGEVHGATVGNGGKLTMNPGCLLAYSPVDIQKGGEIIVNGGKIETNAWFTIAGTLTLNGALQSYEDNSSTWYTIDHDFTFALDQLDAPNASVMISNYELVKTCDASFIVSVSMNQAEGKYKLMGNAANFSGSLSLRIVDYGWDTLTVGKESTINGTKYALAVKNKILTLTVGDSSTLDPDPEPDPDPDPDDLTNAPDTGWNDYLYDKKKGWNSEENIEEFASNEISENGEIYLDIYGTIDKDGRHNMFGNDGTNIDTGDVAKIEVDSAAKLTFSIDSTAAGTFYVYEDGFDKKGNRAQLQVAKVSVKANATTTLKDVCLTADGNYYVAMVAKNVKKAGTEGLYNVSVTNSTFFVDADDGWNNTAAKGNAVEVEHGTTAIVLDTNEMAGSTEFANFVGFSDSIDYAKLNLASSAYLSFNVKADGAAKFTIWKQDAKGKLTKVGGVTSLTAKNKFTATTKAQFFDVDKYQYYLSMECTDAAKGGSAYYDISVSPNSVFFDSSDNGENNWLYDKKENAVNELMGSYVGTYSETWIDFDYDVYHYDYYNFVGYGDTCDYSEIYVDEEGLYNFRIDTTGKAKFTVYSLTRNSKGKWTQKTLGSQTIKDVNGATGVTLKKDVKLSATNDDLRYFVSMQANDTKKSPGVYYNVMSFPTAVSEAAALAMPETSDALAMTDSLSFGQHDTDVLAGTSLDPASDKLLGESGNSLLASL